MYAQLLSISALVVCVTASALDLNEYPEGPADISIPKEQTEEEKAEYSKYLQCQSSCKDKPDNLQCGVNGDWFLNSCYRECTQVPESKTGEECDIEQKKLFQTGKECEKQCSKTAALPECGVDANYYENKCWRECYGVKLADKSVCDKKNALLDCEANCFKTDAEPKPDCGEDGHWYQSKCLRECNSVKLGQVGKHCPTEEEMKKYWNCQMKCADKGVKEVCGKSGHFFQNECHLNCAGEKLGEVGKDCKEESH